MAKTTATLKIKGKGITADFSSMLTNAAKIRGYLNRVVYKQYQSAQAKRWMTENLTETGLWKRLDPKYLTWRQKKFPESGTLIGVREKLLAPSMTGSTKNDHFKLVTDKKLEVGSTLFYAGFYNEQRDITEFSKKTEKLFIKGLEKYLIKGDRKPKGA